MKKMRKALLAILAVMICGCANESDVEYKIGISQIVEHTSLNTIRESMIDELNVLGYVDGEKIEIDYKNAQNDRTTLNSIMQGFAGDNKDLIVAIATPTAMSAAPFASKMPVVFSAVSDPVGAGLVSDPQKPDKNITGTSDEIQVEKILELAMHVDPDLKTLGFIYNASEANSITNLAKTRIFCETNKIKLEEVSVANVGEIQQAATILAGKVDAVFAPNDNTLASGIDALNLALQQVKCPLYVGADSMVMDGGFASIGINYENLGRETARMVVDILNGKDVSNIPVKVFDTDLYTYINVETAKVLGIEIPETILNSEKTILLGNQEE